MRLPVPSVDIMRGKAVRLTQGREDTAKVFGNPVELATKYDAMGFDVLHVVDLDAAFGRKNQFNILEEMRRACSGMELQWSGGLRSGELASAAFNAGADSVVFGTALFKSSDDVIKCAESFGPEKTWGALDFSGNPPAAKIAGWKQGTSVGLTDAVKKAESCKVGGIIVSSVDADGMGKGPNIPLLTQARKIYDGPTWIAGGMRNAADAKLAFEAGAQGVIFGLALYDKKTNLEELLRLREE